MREIVAENAQWVVLGMLTLWALWLNLKLAIVAVKFVSRGRLREAWVNGLRASPPFVRVPRRAKHTRRQMACSVGGTFLPAGVSIKGVSWVDRFGRGWFVPDADYVTQHGYSFNASMDPVRDPPVASRETERMPRTPTLAETTLADIVARRPQPPPR